MTNKFKLTLVAALAGVVFYSCKPDSFKDLGTQPVIASTLAGTWETDQGDTDRRGCKKQGLLPMARSIFSKRT
jgi:hypothetical protein